jgi:hypothetical protein
MATSNVSAEMLLKLERLFEELHWETKNDYAFERFCQTLEFLDIEQQEILLELTGKFLRIDISSHLTYIRKALQEIHNETLRNINTIYVSPLIAKKDLGKSKSSIMIARLLISRELRAKDILNVQNLVLVDRLSNFELMRENHDWLLLFVDDFVGTGETAEEALEEFLQDTSIDQQKIIVMSLVAQESGYNKLRGKGIKFVCAELRRKGISDQYPSPIRERYIDIMTSIEKLIRVKEDFRLGYKASEALVTISRTPNNTFPVYWLEKKTQGKKFIAPFPRD